MRLFEKSEMLKVHFVSNEIWNGMQRWPSLLSDAIWVSGSSVHLQIIEDRSFREPRMCHTAASTNESWGNWDHGVISDALK